MFLWIDRKRNVAGSDGGEPKKAGSDLLVSLSKSSDAHGRGDQVQDADRGSLNSKPALSILKLPAKSRVRKSSLSWSFTETTTKKSDQDCTESTSGLEVGPLDQSCVQSCAPYTHLMFLIQVGDIF